MRFPLIMEIFILSEERTTPNIVAPFGSSSYSKCIVNKLMVNDKYMKCMYLNFPCTIYTQPILIYATNLCS